MTVLAATALLATPTATGAHQKSPRPVTSVDIGKPAFYSARCHDAYVAVRWYRARYDTHRKVLGQSLAPPVEPGMNCHRLRERARYWVRAAKVNRQAAASWKVTIRERPGWLAAIQEAGKAFPQHVTSWLFTCADAEGWRGRRYDREWYTFGWGHYYPGFEHLYIVGGPIQYKWPTFKGHYRHALESLRDRGFRVLLPPPSDVRAWLSFTGQAIAAGWARWSGNDASHWSASWGRGC